ncbi:transcriptional regulator [Pseudomonas asuensis]|uniref:Transcriptional regulator n=1 Tax=Pseudomonas asuensis TaxID=1825787 RepID=A0ABQ2GLJ6_9PSED|nr:transcriptional regulator [Pseudomonas asuensis]
MPCIQEIDELSLFPSIDSELLRTFIAIADSGGFTRAAEVVNRTQSAVSMQMKRLEDDIVRRPLFERDGRQVRLTAEGQVLLGYARRIMALHSEVLNTLREPHMVGTVRLGTPDDYVTRFLPGILLRFAQAYPLVQVEVQCETSLQLLQRHDLDLSIVTCELGHEIGQPLREEPVRWMQAVGSSALERSPLPVAAFNHGCFCRLWMCNALEAAGIDYRIAYSSHSLSAIMAMVGTGLAVTAQLQSLTTPEIEIINEEEAGLPSLPSARIMLVRNPNSQSQVTEALANFITEGFRIG